MNPFNTFSPRFGLPSARAIAALLARFFRRFGIARTEQTEAEDIIRRNNQLLETVLSSIHVMIAYLDRDFNFIKVNRAYAAADHREPEFFPGRNHFDLYPNEENRALFQMVVDTGKPIVYYAKPFRYAEHPERGVTYWDWRAEPITGSDGRVEGIIFSLLDVTEKTLAQKKVEESAAYARSLIEASLDPLITISPEGKITDVNRSTEEVTGEPREKLVGTDFSDYFTESENAREGYRRVLAEGFVRDYPLVIRHKSGKLTDVLYNATLFKNKKGDVQGVFAAARDITERKQAEQALKEQFSTLHAILENIDALVFSLDRQYRYTSFNNAHAAVMRAIYGMEIQLGHSLLDYMTVSEDRETAKQNLDRALRGEHLIESAYSGEDERTRLYFEVSHSPIVAGDGSVIGVVVLSRDTTERKRADEALRRSEARLKEAQRIARMGSWELDLETKALTWSDEVYRIFDIDPGQFGDSYEAFLEAIHPEDREAVDSAYTNSLKTRTPYAIEHRLQFPDGRIKFVYEQCETIYDSDGKPLRSLGTVQDITPFRTEKEITDI